MGFSKLTKLYVINVCFMDDCVGEGWGEGGKKWEEGGSGDVLFWSLPGCVHATLLSTISCNFLNCYLFTYETYLRVLKNSFKWAFYIESEFVGFWRPGENRSARWKTSRSKGENQQQSQPKYGVYPGCLRRDLNPGAIIDGRGVRVSRLLQPCSPELLKYVIWKEITR